MKYLTLSVSRAGMQAKESDIKSYILCLGIQPLFLVHAGFLGVLGAFFA